MNFSQSAEVNDVPPKITEHFSEVPLMKDGTAVRCKAPRKILHFSDGILEEYSSEDESEALTDDTQTLAVVDPKTLSWIPYFFHLALQMGTKTLAVCDYLGEHLAYFFGITSPKYQYELEEYQKMVQEEEEEKKKEAEQMAGWRAEGDAELGVTVQPSAALPPPSELEQTTNATNATPAPTLSPQPAGWPRY